MAVLNVDSATGMMALSFLCMVTVFIMGAVSRITSPYGSDKNKIPIASSRVTSASLAAT